MRTSCFNKRMRLLSWLLALAMLFGLAPVSAWAAGSTFCQVAGVTVTEENKERQITGEAIYGYVDYDETDATLRFRGRVELGSEAAPCSESLFHFLGNAVTLDAEQTVEGWTQSSGFFMPSRIRGETYILHGSAGQTGLAGHSDTTIVEKDTTVELDGFGTGLGSGGVQIKGTVIIRDAQTGISDGGKTLEPGGTLEVHAATPVNGALTYNGGHLILDSTDGTPLDARSLTVLAAGAVWYRTEENGDFAQTTAADFTLPAASYLELTDADPSVCVYDLWVSGEQVTDANAEDVLGDGTVRFDSATSTLTLTDAGLIAPQNSRTPACLVTELPELRVTGNATFCNGDGIYSRDGNVTIENANLKFDPSDGGGIGLGKILTVTDSTLEFTGKGGESGTDAFCAAILAEDGIRISGSSIRIDSLAADGTTPYYWRGIATNDLTVENSTLDLQAAWWALIIDTGMTVSGRDTVIAAEVADENGCAIRLMNIEENGPALHDGLAVLEGKCNESKLVKIGVKCAHEYQASSSDDSDVEAYIGAAVVIGGGAAALAYYYREALPIWKLAGVVTLAADTADAAAAPVANATVALLRDGETVKTLTTDANGMFTARLPKGEYESVVTWEKDGVAYAARGTVTAESVLEDGAVQEIVLTKGA